LYNTDFCIQRSFIRLKLAETGRCWCNGHVTQDADRDSPLKQEAAARLTRVADAVLKAPKITRSMDDDVRITTL